jgi:hypothetical protein
MAPESSTLFVDTTQNTWAMLRKIQLQKQKYVKLRTAGHGKDCNVHKPNRVKTVRNLKTSHQTKL